MVQSTYGNHLNLINSMNIDASDVYISVWGRIDDSNIRTVNSPIIPAVNQRLTMCAVVGGHVDELGVTLMIQFPINSDTFCLLCRIWVKASN